MRFTDLIPVINMVMPYINTVILDYLQVLDPDSGIRMCNPASANDSGEWAHWQRRPPYPASANDSEIKRSQLSALCSVAESTYSRGNRYIGEDRAIRLALTIRNQRREARMCYKIGLTNVSCVCIISKVAISYSRGNGYIGEDRAIRLALTIRNQ